ncbi:MAG: hypothetical protein JXO49_03325 [Deltaproteobacteria bacterium]|nr:hypothetical protein [Candidatus Anaeroferrophillus wilburensis]MBN2888360.1 hypothetical protein [Deltaproteobacteria bacterium]
MKTQRLMDDLALLLDESREICRELETSTRLLAKSPAETWSTEILQHFQQHRNELFAALEKINQAIGTIHNRLPAGTRMPADFEALIKDQMELIGVIQTLDQQILAQGKILKKQLEPLLGKIKTYQRLFKKFQPTDEKPAPRFFKATI